MVKNKDLPDSAVPPVWSHPLALSLSLHNAVHPEGTPWILLRLDPGTLLFFRFFPNLLTEKICFNLILLLCSYQTFRERILKIT